VAEALEVLKMSPAELHPIALSFEVTETRGGRSATSGFTITSVERDDFGIRVNYDLIPPPGFGSHRPRGEAKDDLGNDYRALGGHFGLVARGESTDITYGANMRPGRVHDAVASPGGSHASHPDHLGRVSLIELGGTSARSPRLASGLPLALTSRLTSRELGFQHLIDVHRALEITEPQEAARIRRSSVAHDGPPAQPCGARMARYNVRVMSVSPQQRDRLNVALAAVTCGRLSHAARVRTSRGQCSASADQYGVNVTEPRPRSPAARDTADESGLEAVFEHWGGDAEMLVLRSPLKGTARRSAPLERARVAARTVRDYDLDSLQIAYLDGAELSADRIQVVLYGPRQGFLRRRDQLVRATVGELL
jgi:hypothetical protein